MKKIRYADKKESFFKSKRFISILMGLFIISIMVFSILYYGLDNTGQEKIEYKGLTFTQTSLGWQTYTNSNQRILIQTNPEYLDFVTYLGFGDIEYFFSLQKIYVSFNPEENVASALIDFQANTPSGVSLVGACSVESELCVQLPLKTCEDATIANGVVIYKESNESKITQEGNCLIIEGEDLLTLTDKLVVEAYV